MKAKYKIIDVHSRVDIRGIHCEMQVAIDSDEITSNGFSIAFEPNLPITKSSIETKIRERIEFIKAVETYKKKSNLDMKEEFLNLEGEIE